MPDSAWEAWFENAWAAREEAVYRSHFGDLGPGIYALGADVFPLFKQDSVDPRWLTHGVFACPPRGDRENWLYVSSGLSNAWEASAPDPDGVSGLGCEFILECPLQSQWALLLLQRMVAFQILLAAGRFPGKPPLGRWDRVPLRSPIDGASSQLTWVMLAPSLRFSGPQQIPSGRFHFLQFVGITNDEAEYARREGSEMLLPLLLENRAAPVTNPSRQSVLSS